MKTPLQLNIVKWGFCKKFAVDSQKVGQIVEEIAHCKLHNLVDFDAERSICFKAETSVGALFVKVFHCEYNPQEFFALAQKCYQVVGRNYLSVCAKLAKDVYVAVNTWVDGRTLTRQIDSLSPEQKQQAGKDIGILLQTLHRLDSSRCPRVPYKAKTWLNRLYFGVVLKNKGNKKLSDLHSFAKNNLSQIKDNNVYCHGDVHINNLLVNKSQEIFLVDFDSMVKNHPYADLVTFLFLPKQFHPFCKSVVESYFDGVVPKDFWQVGAVFCAIYGLMNVNVNREMVDIAHQIITDENHQPTWWKNYK